MYEFSLDKSILSKMSENPRGVQTAICIIANLQFDPSFYHPFEPKLSRPLGIGKYQGGVTVNGRQICIRERNVMDDWKRSAEDTPEERAVVDAIYLVAEIVEQDGAQSLSITYGDQITYDPLRSFFEPVLKL